MPPCLHLRLISMCLSIPVSTCCHKHTAQSLCNLIINKQVLRPCYSNYTTLYLVRNSHKQVAPTFFSLQICSIPLGDLKIFSVSEISVFQPKWKFSVKYGFFLCWYQNFVHLALSLTVSEISFFFNFFNFCLILKVLKF